MEHPEGVILIDPGITKSSLAQVSKGMKIGWRMQVDKSIDAGLGEVGLTRSDVRWVVPTHGHVDHASGALEFPAAAVLVHGREYDYMRAFPWRVACPKLPRGWTPSLYDLERRPLGPFDRSLPLTDDGRVVFVPTPGHTPGSVSVVVRDGNDRALFFSGDHSASAEIFARECAEDRLIQLYPSPKQARHTRDRICGFRSETPTVYLPAHDPGAARRLETWETL